MEDFDSPSVMDKDLSNTAPSELGLARQILITLAFLIGAVGNIAALWILYKSAKTRNRKHVLMLRCLATNDLVAQLGMLVLMNLNHYQLIPTRLRCILYVGLRAFGLGSGCVAFVMALERWLALTRPFRYHQLVTYPRIKRAILTLWTTAVFLTYLPLLNFGLYFKDNKCARYRDAQETKDIIYAYLFMLFGTNLCVCIAFCNLTVIWEVAKIGSPRRTLVRRVSRSIINNRVDGCTRYVTSEELAFAKLMAILCIIFVVCWMPQMISIPLAQFFPKSSAGKIFSRVADFLMCVYFTLNPYVYVLQRYMENSRLKFSCIFRRSVDKTPSTSVEPTTTLTSVLLHPPAFTNPTVM